MSRGLGDVYKRQGGAAQSAATRGTARTGPVSYTHLTLPTN
ncbi:hypothetical protein JMUB7556_28420 [Staphylococcus aureus]